MKVLNKYKRDKSVDCGVIRKSAKASDTSKPKKKKLQPNPCFRVLHVFIPKTQAFNFPKSRNRPKCLNMQHFIFEFGKTADVRHMAAFSKLTMSVFEENSKLYFSHDVCMYFHIGS
ncbi:Hypothetical protein CINCED_3A019721 [Cinara cedri]|uniref:Uncharacterized protein n=1 Tax=Cinara cedri TaxID=506608 RepID=A0A5E4N527_9HEMI|nr:Hypothetical protein CINCED_3A019721 [Cinara cedri]